MFSLTVRPLLLALLYWGGVEVGLLFFENQISILWPANGIALAFFMVSAPRQWPLLGLAMSVGYFLGLIGLSAQPVPVKIGFLLANFIEIVPAAYLIRRRLAADVKLDSLNGILSFLGLGVVAGPLVGSLTATLVAQAGFGQPFSLNVWIGWGIGNAVSTLAVCLPTYFLLSRYLPEVRPQPGPRGLHFSIEPACFFGFSILAIYLVFVPVPGFSLLHGSAVILFIFALWGALRFPTPVVSGWLLLIVLCAAGFTLAPDSPFAVGAPDFRATVFNLHIFSFSLCLTCLLLAGITTDRGQIENSLRVANNAKSEFLSSMSHELRTPLNAILGFSELIELQAPKSEIGSRIREYAGDINRAGQHLLSLINDILDLAKIEAGKVELEEEILDVPSIIDAAANLIRDSAHLRGVAFEVEIEPHPAMLRADERKLRQMLINLLTNAVKFTEAGGRITLGVWHGPEAGYVFRVADTGIGIAPDNISKALSKFDQVDNSLARKYEGTGLGLPLTQALVEQHGGTLELESTVGTGTTAARIGPARDLPEPRRMPYQAAG